MITCDNDYTIRLASQLTIDKNMTIDGTGHNVTASGDTNGDDTGDVRVFYVNPGITFNLNQLTVTKGNASPSLGSGIYTQGTVNVTNSIFTDNSNWYGGIYAYSGTVNVTNSTFSGNRDSIGIYNGTVNVTNSTLANPSVNNFDFNSGGSGTVTAKNVIVVKGGGQNCVSSRFTASSANNLADNASCGASFTN